MLFWEMEYQCPKHPLNDLDIPTYWQLFYENIVWICIGLVYLNLFTAHFFCSIKYVFNPLFWLYDSNFVLLLLPN